MTYKEGIDRFKVKYDLKGGTRNLTDEVILMLLSEVYADLANKYRLVKKTKTVRLVSGQSTYAKGSGTDNFPSDYLSIKSIKFGEGTTSERTLNKVSINEIPNGDLPSGKPTKYALWLNNGSETLYLDAEPDLSYTADNTYLLTVYYLAKIFTYSGTAENSFSDVDFTSATFGGSFLTPTEWDNVIIDGAIANLLGDVNLIQANMVNIKDLEQRKPGENLSVSYSGGV